MKATFHGNELVKAIRLVNDICENVSSLYQWVPCAGLFKNNGKVQGAMCDTETGRIYIECNTEDKGPHSETHNGMMYFRAWIINGKNNPYDDNGKHIEKEGYLYKYSWEEAIETMEFVIS